jgi:hypothetical protein
MNEIDYAARVAKGAALLDEKRPGWEREISLSTLDIASPTRCVTAQLSGENWYIDGMEQLGLVDGNDASYVAHGFSTEDIDAPEAYGLDCAVGEEDVNVAVNAAFDTLNTLWRVVISARLAVPTDGV